MNVKRDDRKKAILLMLHYRKLKHQAGEIAVLPVTAYTVATWHSVAQSGAWQLLNELCKSRFVNRHKSCSEKVIITYSLTKRGQTYVDKHVLECIAAHTLVLNFKMDKYKRGLSE